ENAEIHVRLRGCVHLTTSVRDVVDHTDDGQRNWLSTLRQKSLAKRRLARKGSLRQRSTDDDASARSTGNIGCIEVATFAPLDTERVEVARADVMPPRRDRRGRSRSIRRYVNLIPPACRQPGSFDGHVLN